MKKPKVLVLKTEGTNCDEETAFAFELAGGMPKIVHINELRTKSKKFNDFNILALPGGFSYGDDIVSGKILAIELTSFFSEELKKFTQRKNTAVIGICNGFQTLIRTGLLPFNNLGNMSATLTNNDSGRFECRWVNLSIEQKTRCEFLNNITIKQYNNNPIISFQVAHGEGKFFAPKDIIEQIEKQNLVCFRYTDENGNQTQQYPKNPNGSINAIAGICDPTGHILGLMPHPEKFVDITQHPNWRRDSKIRNNKPDGAIFFEQLIQFVSYS